MRNADYWQKRFDAIEEMTTQAGEAIIPNMERIFAGAQRDLENQISGWYNRFAVNNQIDLQEARRLLNSNQLAEFRWSVDEYIAYGKLNTISGQWSRQLENASARFHMSRLEALKLQTQNTIERAFGNQLDSLDTLIKRQLLDNFHHPIFEIQSGFNIGWDIAGLNEAQLDVLMRKPWTAEGFNFSDRLWRDKDRLVNELHTQLTQGLITGASPQQMTENLAKQMNTTKNNAARLIMTESTAFAAIGHKAAYDELGVEVVRILETLDKRTCPLCARLDSTIIRMAEYQIGITVPPFHPFCRGTTVPHFDDSEGARAARDADGRTYYIPNNTTYQDWKDGFVDGGDKSNFTEIDQHLQDFTKRIDSIAGISSEYREALIQRFNNGTDVAKAVFNKHVPMGSVATGMSEGAFFRPADGKIYMNFVGDLNNPRGSGSTFFHEQGHLIDFASSPDTRGIAVSRGKYRLAKKSDGYLNRLANSLSEDYNRMLENMANPNIKSAMLRRGDVNNQLSALLRGENADLLSAMSDILEGMTNTSAVPIRGAWGHGSKYWKARPIGVQTEAFAHLFELQFDPVKLSMFEEYFPTTVKIFAEILEGLR